MARCKCGIRIWKGSLCDACRTKAIETAYGLSFTGSYAKPTEKFWRAWRKDADAVKRRGLRVRKEGSVWIVSKAPRMM